MTATMINKLDRAPRNIPIIRSSTLLVMLVVMSCTTRSARDQSVDQGIAEVHVNGSSILTANITRVTLVAENKQQDLMLNLATGTFDGTLILPSGMHNIIASAFANDLLVGQSQSSSVVISAGVITRVMLRILDVTPMSPMIYGPIVDSLSYPTTVNAGVLATFTISVVAPAGDPITYLWTSDCQDSTFTAPDSATTSWSRTVQGACTITVAATSNGFTVTQSFVIVVFPSGSDSGAVAVDSVFVSKPAIALSLPGVNCDVVATGNGSCPVMIASPDVTSYDASVFNWGSDLPGTLELSDNCGGRFGTSNRNVGDVSGFWLPPVGGGLCILTARAVNGDGLVATVSAAILVHAGTAPAATQPPALETSLAISLSPDSTTFFFFDDSSPPKVLGPFAPGKSVFVSGIVSWQDGLPGSLAITDSCIGPRPQPDNLTFFFQTASWNISDVPGMTCTITVQATNLQGVGSSINVVQYQVTAP